MQVEIYNSIETTFDGDKLLIDDLRKNFDPKVLQSFNTNKSKNDRPSSIDPNSFVRINGSAAEEE